MWVFNRFLFCVALFTCYVHVRKRRFGLSRSCPLYLALMENCVINNNNNNEYQFALISVSILIWP